MNTISLLNNDEDIRIETNSNGEEQYIFDPFNSLNKEIKPENIKEILNNYGLNNIEIYNFELYNLFVSNLKLLSLIE